jgi:hypothetical protein
MNRFSLHTGKDHAIRMAALRVVAQNPIETRGHFTLDVA